MGGKSQPNYQQAAVAQGEANREVVRDQTFGNRVNQFTPWGSTQWNPFQTVDPSTGEAVTAWEQVQTLTPELQEILNKQMAIQTGRSDIAGALTNRMGSEFLTPMDWRGLTPMGEVPTNQFTIPENVQRQLDLSDAPSIAGPKQQTQLDYSGAPAVGDPNATRTQAEEAVYQQAMSRIEPQFEGQKQQAEIQMRNQGLRPGDAAWEARMGQINTQQNDARNQALWSASQAGRDEAGQMFGQQMDLRNMATGEQDRMGQFSNNAWQNLFNMQAQNRNQFVGERGMLADFYNRTGQQMFDQANVANQANYNQMMQSSQYANQLRQQQISEAMTKRGFSLNEINALLSGQQVQAPQMPNFSQASVAQAAPIYQGAVDQGNYQAATSPWNALMGIGGSALGAAGAANGFGNLFS